MLTDPCLTRLSVEETADPHSLRITGPEAVFNSGDKFVLNDRLRRADGAYIITPYKDEALHVRQTGPELDESRVVATITRSDLQLVLRVHVDPSRHDTVEVVITRSIPDHGPPDPSLSKYQGRSIHDPHRNVLREPTHS